MTLHRSPVRRSVRQKSGHNVAGAGTGSTAKIVTSTLYQPENNLIRLEFSLASATVPKLFLRDIGILGGGIYLYAEDECRLGYELSWDTEAGRENIVVEKHPLEPQKWMSIGSIQELSITEEVVVENLVFRLEFETQGNVNLFGVMIGGLSHEYLEEKDVYAAFKIKTNLYIPEILYLNPEASAEEEKVLQGTGSGEGRPLILKSCNRCTRFLPIDIKDETNALGYSNHCIGRAPCKHSAFSRFKIENEYKPGGSLDGYIIDGVVRAHYGFQLECRVCKKFFVNKDLNPMRNSTQHREDGLRRRAFEVLVNEVAPNGFSYRNFELQSGESFDVYIWKKFSKKCFNCDKDLATQKDMDLDHTLPLAFLWGIDETATCLCPTCNGSKLNKFPIDFYRPEQLPSLSSLTGLNDEKLRVRKINETVMDALLKRIEWFFDEFLARRDYQKVREGKRASDLIVHALHNSIKTHNANNEKQYPVDLVSVYVGVTGRVPSTVDTV